MKPSDKSLDKLLKISRSAPPEEPPSIPFGFATRLAQRACKLGASEDAVIPAVRWSFALCLAATIVVAAITAPSVFSTKFTPETAFQSHVSELVLFGEK